MNIQDTAKTRSAYAIGQPVLRKEDSKLLRGEGRYTDDINLPGQAYAYILRSNVAHGRIKSIDTAAAKAMPGVLGDLHRRRRRRPTARCNRRCRSRAATAPT